MVRRREGHGRRRRSVAGSDLRPWEAMEEGKKAVGSDSWLATRVLTRPVASSSYKFDSERMEQIGCHQDGRE